jgi:hypothetical protein
MDLAAVESDVLERSIVEAFEDRDRPVLTMAPHKGHPESPNRYAEPKAAIEQ